jgi:4-hydroxybenzoate polyprenyltransferase
MGQSDIASTHPFRVEDWWRSKAALLMGFVYLFALWFDIPMQAFIPLSVLSVVVIIGFASFGYVVNDFFDKEKDRLSGKKNFLLGKSTSYQIGLVLLTLAFVSFSWLYLPATFYSFILISIQLTLFIIYSVPPLRLKEKGIAGLITDALYAHAVPVVLAAYTFLLASGRSLPWLSLILLSIWQFAIGIRNILLHQSEDIDADARSRTQNYSASLSERARHHILLFNLAFELLFCVLFFLSLAGGGRYKFIACLLPVLFFYIWAYLKYSSSIGLMLHSTWRYFPNNVYEKWLPIVYLILLSFYNVYFIVFIVLHLVLFNFDFYSHTARSVALYLRLLRPRIITPAYDFAVRASSFFVNYLIYYSLLLVGINLKKENISAMEYFKNRRKKR